MKLVRNELFRSVEFKGKANTEPYHEWIILILFLIIAWLVYFILAPIAAMLTSPTLLLFNENERRTNQEEIKDDKTNKGYTNVFEEDQRVEKRFVDTLLN